MKRLFFFLALSAFLGLGISFAQQPIIMGNGPSLQSVYEEAVYFYDPGYTGNFGLGIRDTLTIRNGLSEPGQLWMIFDDFAMGYGDSLFVFDGQECTESNLVGAYNSVSSPEDITSTTGFLTFVFHSDSIDDYGLLKSGWVARAYVEVTSPTTLWLNLDDGHGVETNSCNVKFYDSGGPNGNINATGTYHCNFSSPNSHVKMEFVSFNVAGVMKIYDGKYGQPGTRLIGQFHSTTVDPTLGNKPPVFFSSGHTLSVEYVPGSGDASKPGWDATITCVPELFESPDGSACPEVVIQDENGDDFPSLPDSIIHTCGVPIIMSAKVTATGRYTNDYTVRQIPFNLHPYEFNAGTQVSASYDDKWLASVELPFQFSFFGKNYSIVYPGTNGIISFNPRTALTGCVYKYSPPAATPPYSTPTASGGTPDANTPHCYKNSIYGVFEDIDISTGTGWVYRDVLGSYPCRTFVFNFNEIPEFGNNSNKCTYQMVLYEGTNIIDIFVKKRQCCASTNGPSNNNEGIIGLQNSTSSQILIAPGRDMTSWSVQQNQSEAWRFTPITPMDEDATIEWFENTVSDSTSIGHSKKLAVDPQQTTDYIIKYHFTNAGNNSFDLYDTVHVSVEVPDLALDTFTVCPGKTVTLKPVFGDTTDIHPQDYYWSTTDTSDTLSLVARSTQEYELKVIFDNNCQRTAKTVVNVDTMAVPVITGDTVICLGDMARLVAAVDSPSYVLRWANGLESDVLVVRPAATSDYVVKAVHPDDEECFTMDTITVKVNPLPELSFTYSPEEVVIEHGVGTLTCHTNCDPDYNIVWNFNDRYNPENNIVEGLHTVSHDFVHVGSYDITLAGTNEFECRDSVTEHVRVYVPVSFVMPNAFTPNDDGLNDVFKPVYEGVEMAKYLMLIYDRAGRLMFKSSNPAEGWDGRDPNGIEMPSGVYVYYIHHWTQMDDLRGNGQPAVTGTFTLIR